MVVSFRRCSFVSSTALLLRANRRKIACSALKLLMTEKPFRLSLSVAVKLALRSETVFSTPARRLPVKSDTSTGRNESTKAASVSNGLYQSIMANAPRKNRQFCSSGNSPSR